MALKPKRLFCKTSFSTQAGYTFLTSFSGLQPLSEDLYKGLVHEIMDGPISDDEEE